MRHSARGWSIEQIERGCELFVAEDFYVDSNYRSTFMDWVTQRLHSAVTSDELDLDKVTNFASSIISPEIASETAKFFIRINSLMTALEKHFQKHGYPELDNAYYWDFASAGLKVKIHNDILGKMVKLHDKAIRRAYAQIATEVTAENYPDLYQSWGSRRLTYLFSDPRLSLDFIGDPNKPLLERALWRARRDALYAAANSESNVFDVVESSAVGELVLLGRTSPNPDALRRGISSLKLALDSKPDAGAWMRLRRQVLEAQTQREATVKYQKARLNGERFETYWSQLKSAIQSQDSETAHLEFAKIPLLPLGTSSSRTWGIEIETTRANETSRPNGWRSEYDGSLPGGSAGECDCGCEDCYDGDEHCDDRDSDCYRNADESSSREFVSPILEHYNSAGLRKLCADLGTDEHEDAAAGIHVHVGADDLSVVDVANLLLAYSAVEKLFTPLLHRKSRSYCKPTTTAQLRWWLAQVREYRKNNPTSWPEPRLIAHNAPDDRYYDVNVQSLSKHGTIEFRAMGAWYDYEHLARWAWLVREMVNVSKLGIELREWTRCKSISDVVALLRKYGTEAPSDALFADLKSADFGTIDEQ